MNSQSHWATDGSHVIRTLVRILVLKIDILRPAPCELPGGSGNILHVSKEFIKYDPTDVCTHGRRASKDRRTDRDNPKMRKYESAKVPSLKCESISESLTF